MMILLIVPIAGFGKLKQGFSSRSLRLRATGSYVSADTIYDGLLRSGRLHRHRRGKGQR